MKLWSKYYTEYQAQEIFYHLHHCTRLPPLCRMTEHLTLLWLLTLRCFTSHCHSENTISGSHWHIRLIHLMYSKHQVWPVPDYNEIVSELTENRKVSSDPRCMYMSVKYIGKRCYVHCESSKPVKRIILNLCINYHIKRWFAQSEVSSSLAPNGWTRAKKNFKKHFDRFYWEERNERWGHQRRWHLT